MSTKEIIKEITTSVIAIGIVGGGIASLFIPELNELAARLLQSLSTLVIGYYFGAKNIPLSAFGSKGKK